MRFLFDNDIFNLYLAGDAQVVARVLQNRPQVCLSSIAAEERIAGHLSAINYARNPRNSLSLSRAHEDFPKALEDLLTLPILSYSDKAETIFRSFFPAVLRVGSQDCRIAAQASAHNLLVVTRNVRHFASIGVPFEDWSRAAEADVTSSRNLGDDLTKPR